MTRSEHPEASRLLKKLPEKGWKRWLNELDGDAATSQAKRQALLAVLKMLKETEPQ